MALIGGVVGAQAIFDAGGVDAVLKALDAVYEAVYQAGLDWYKAHGLPTETRPIALIGGIRGAENVLEEEGPQGVRAALDAACEWWLRRAALSCRS